MSSSGPAFQEPGMTSGVLKLLRLRMRIVVNGFRRSKGFVKIGYIVIGVAILAMIGFFLFASIALLGFLSSPRIAQHIGDVTPLLESMPSLTVTVSAFGILLTSFSALLQVLYLSGDMDFLMSAPLAVRTVFVAKLVQAVVPNFSILCALTLPLLFGLGISCSYSIFYYPFVIFVLAVISLEAAALASLLVLVVVRFFPARRVAEVLGFIVGTTVFVLSQSGRFADFDLDKVDDRQLSGFLGIVERFNYAWSPLAWAGRGLVELGKGEWLPASGLLAAALIFAGLVFCVAFVASERLYYTGWANLKNNRRKSKKKTGIGRFLPADRPASFTKLNPLNRLIPVPILAVLVKDLRLFRRDLSNLSSLLFPMILGVVYAISLLRSGGKFPEGRGEAPPAFIEAGNAMMNYTGIGLVLLLGGMLVNNLAGFSFSREGKNYWFLKAAPLDAKQLLTAKFLAGYMPSALICSIYLVIFEILKRTPPLSIAVSLLTVWMALAGMTGISLALGIRGAKFDWENPSQVQRTIGCMGQLIGILFLLVYFMLFVAPGILAEMLHLPPVAGQLGGILLCGVASALAAIIPITLTHGRVALLDEN
jgi:ABC-2 type transport system permease protein